MPNDTLSCTDISIRVDKPTPGGVIVPALEVIQPGLYYMYITANSMKNRDRGGKGADLVDCSIKCVALIYEKFDFDKRFFKI